MADVLFVADQVSPVRGMEKALADLVSTIADEVALDVVALSGPSSPLLNRPAQLLELAGTARRPAMATGELRRLFRGADVPGVVVAGALWSALPVLLAAGRRPPFHLIVWEHSVLPWRLEHVRSLRLMAAAVYRR